MSILGSRSDERRIVANLLVQDGADASAFYQEAFDARELYRYTLPNGRVVHAQLQLGDCFLLVTQEFESDGTTPLRAPGALGGSTVVLEMYVEDVDAALERSLAAGATVKMPLTDTFYGDRACEIVDPFGHVWGLATVKEVLTADEVGRRAELYFALQTA